MSAREFKGKGSEMRIAMIGTGYVGLVSGACFAQAGHQVTCVDIDCAKVAMLNSGGVPICEPGLAEIIAEGRRKATLRFSSDVQATAAAAQAIFVAVGTPSKESDGHADLSGLYRAIEEIAPALRRGCLVVIKSTVPVGTGDEVDLMIRRLRPGPAFEVASNPEFLRAGCAITDFTSPDRVVIGAESDRALVILRSLYHEMGIDGARIVATQRRSAELIKYAANGFLATKIAFINEIADLCESVDARVSDVALGIGLDNRIGKQFLSPGPGFGGSCFPKDAKALVKAGEDHGTPMRIIEAVLASNERRKRSIAAKVRAASGGDVRGKRIALFGLTFKAGTDDMRDSPSIALAHALVEGGATVHAYDPVGVERARPLLPKCVRYHATALDAARGAHMAVVVTEWDEFRELDFAMLKQQMMTPLLVDLRNMFSKERMTGSGFKYWGLGKGSSFIEERALSISLRRRSATGGGYRARHESDELSPMPFSQSIAAAE
jgi:UDPglucose 6-dehydrogenase